MRKILIGLFIVLSLSACELSDGSGGSDSGIPSMLDCSWSIDPMCNVLYPSNPLKPSIPNGGFGNGYGYGF